MKTETWRPSATISALRQRAQLLDKLRRFFAEREVLEVETPLLDRCTVTAVHIDSFAVPIQSEFYYLQTSPEYAMKRLLAAGSGCIYQICKAFRAEESGRLHNPEFTLLEWYRIGFTHHQLMDEISLLLHEIVALPAAQRMSYQQLFMHHCHLDVLNCKVADLRECVIQHHLNITNLATLDADTCQQLLLTHVIEPTLGWETPIFIYDFPCSQAALAKISATDPAVANRFELYINGLEVANGFHELTDAIVQTQRFQQDQMQRRELGKTVPDIDKQLLAALQHGLPDCAGVALGIDRLLMIMQQVTHIEQVLSFPLHVSGG